jgi:heme/copper-type cytochrome/quinol oxidase subunit 3
MIITCMLGSVFVGQWYSWVALVDKDVYFVGNPAGSFLYVFTGLHALHLISGVIFLIIVLISSFRYKVHSKEYGCDGDVRHLLAFSWRSLALSVYVLIIESLNKNKLILIIYVYDCNCCGRQPQKRNWGGGNEPLNASYGKLMMWFFLLSDIFTFAAFLILICRYQS